jgi:hypothetical protein
MLETLEDRPEMSVVTSRSSVAATPRKNDGSRT